MSEIDLRLGRWQGIAERFWSKVIATNGACWLWSGAVGRNGYGNLRVGSTRDGTRRSVSAHRVAFELAGGNPGAAIVMHSCDNKRCVNPAHLTAGTQRDNVRDCVAKGRWRQGDRAPASCSRNVSGELNPGAKLTREDVEILRAGAWMSWEQAGRSVGISGTHAKRVIRGVSWP